MPTKQGEEQPQSFGRFKVLRPLGRGGMGMVYLAEDPVIGRQVAIKVVKADPGLAEDEVHELQTRFEREFQSAGTLSHPNIVTVFDVGKEGDASFFAMEYLPGESLSDIMRFERAQSFKEIADFATKICSALDYAHDHGVVHRDIKPANILIDRSGEPKITDFGVAKLTSTNLTRTGTVVGTPSYMSPEQVTGQPVSGVSDQFSVAVILYQMLTGELPFTGENPTTILYKIVHETPVRPHEKKRSLPPQVDQVLLRALEKKPENRYTRCLDLANAVREALGVAAQELDLAFDQPESTLQMRHHRGRAKKVAGKKRKVWPLAAAAGALVIAAVAGYLFVYEDGAAFERLSATLGAGTAQTFSRTIFVQAEEGGAAIWKNDEDTGLLVPAEVPIEGQEGDTVRLELRREGHTVARHALTLDAGMPAEWVATEEALPTQTFSVATRPEGASVFLGDEMVAESTPARIELTPGEEYRLRVELADYHPESYSFVFPDGLDGEILESERFFFPLRPVIPPAQLVVQASYPLQVVVSGRSHGPAASHDITVRPGTYEVVLRSEEVFLEERRQVEVGSDERVELEAPEAAEIRVAAQPGNCQVHINDRLIDETPFTQRLVPGTYEFRFEWPALGESRTYTETITAGTGEVFGSPQSR